MRWFFKFLFNAFRWIYGVVFCFVSIGGFLNGEIGLALLILVIGLLLLPPVTKAIRKRKERVSRATSVVTFSSTRDLSIDYTQSNKREEFKKAAGEKANRRAVIENKANYIQLKEDQENLTLKKDVQQEAALGEDYVLDIAKAEEALLEHEAELNQLQAHLAKVQELIQVQNVNLHQLANDAKSKSERSNLLKESKQQLRQQIIQDTAKSEEKSVIDVTGEGIKISYLSPTIIRHQEIKEKVRVPYWRHQYVYSYSELRGANAEQVKFYKYFKTSFLNGEYLDIEGNTNYAFILLFDLLNNDYETHKDLDRLERELNALGQYYPKTESYGKSFLIQKMQAAGDYVGVERVRAEQYGSYYSQNQSNYDYWRLGSKYKTTLNLTDEEVNLLNKLWNPYNNFCNIEFCLLEILKLYLSVLNGLEEKFFKENTSLSEEFNAVADVIARKYFKYRKNSNNYKYSLDTSVNEIYALIFKHCENAVREHFGHKRKLSTDTVYHSQSEVVAELDARVISHISQILPISILDVNPPDEATEVELNSQNTTRWKIHFDKLTQNFSGEDGRDFVTAVLKLGELNKKNPSVENIFYEASKFIAKADKEAALTLYIHYLFHDLKSATFNNKQLTKTIQKSLFKTNEQLHNFEIIVSDLIKNKDLDKALQAVKGFYAPKRKRVLLNTQAIEEVHMKHSGTVELLNEYLQDEYEDEQNTIKAQEVGEEEIKLEITQKVNSITQPNSSNVLGLTSTQFEVLELFAKNSYQVHQDEIEAFARERGVFKNQLIESINDACYDALDDLLIEEEDEDFIVNENYYNSILAL